jgi:hypothetical protein
MLWPWCILLDFLNNKQSFLSSGVLYNILTTLHCLDLDHLVHCKNTYHSSGEPRYLLCLFFRINLRL